MFALRAKIQVALDCLIVVLYTREVVGPIDYSGCEAAQVLPLTKDWRVFLTAQLPATFGLLVQCYKKHFNNELSNMRSELLFHGQ